MQYQPLQQSDSEELSEALIPSETNLNQKLLRICAAVTIACIFLSALAPRLHFAPSSSDPPPLHKTDSFHIAVSAPEHTLNPSVSAVPLRADPGNSSGNTDHPIQQSVVSQPSLTPLPTPTLVLATLSKPQMRVSVSSPARWASEGPCIKLLGGDGPLAHIIRTALTSRHTELVCGQCLENPDLVVIVGSQGGVCSVEHVAAARYHIYYTIEALEKFTTPATFQQVSQTQGSVPENKLFDIRPGTPSPSLVNVPYVLHLIMTQAKDGKDLRAHTSQSIPIQERPYAVAYINRNCVNHREALFAELVTALGSDLVHGLGKCSHNFDADVQGSFSSPQLAEQLQKYVFVFGMENMEECPPGYITEKILTAFRSGAIPIYWGHVDTILKYFNPAAFVLANDYPSIHDAAVEIAELYHNATALQEMVHAPAFKDGQVPDVRKDSEVRRAVRLLREAYKDKLEEGI